MEIIRPTGFHINLNNDELKAVKITLDIIQEMMDYSVNAEQNYKDDCDNEYDIGELEGTLQVLEGLYNC